MDYTTHISVNAIRKKKISTIPYTKLVPNKFDLFGQEGNHGMNLQKENERELYNFN